MRRSNEPLFWSLFSAGGMLAALLAPVLIVLTGFLVPAHEVSFGRLHAIVTNPAGRVVLFAFASLTFFHWAHRFRHVLIDVGLRRFGPALGAACYLAALAGSVWAGVVAFT
ncbi:MAG: fumarate reductase subunit D [Acidobacteriota bacterium]|nr:fumarate reductase subunit D [Acidobacteriota bacterium]